MTGEATRTFHLPDGGAINVTARTVIESAEYIPPAPAPDPAPDPTPGPGMTLRLIDPVADDLVRVLDDHIEIIGATEFNVAAIFDGEQPASVRFELGDRVHTERVAPFALFGDRGGDFMGEALPVGDHQLRVIAEIGGSQVMRDIILRVADEAEDDTDPPIEPPTEPPGPMPDPDVDGIHVTPLTIHAALGSDRTLILAPGNYGSLDLGGMKSLALIGQSATDVIIEGLRAKGADSLHLENLDFVYNPHDGERTLPFRIERAEDVTVKLCFFTGLPKTEDGYGEGFGLNMVYCDRAKITQCTFDGFYKSLSLSGYDCEITLSEFMHFESDALNFARAYRLKILGNLIHSRMGDPDSGSHPDGIQFWASMNDRTAPAPHDVHIEGNVLHVTAGSWFQMIFMNSDGRKFRRFTIINNMLIGAHTHGLSMKYLEDSLVEHVTCLRSDQSDRGADAGAGVVPGIMVKEGSARIAIRKCLGSHFGVHETATDITLEDNVTLPVTEYDGHIVNPHLASGRIQDFIAAWNLKQTSPLAASGVGVRVEVIGGSGGDA